MLVSFQLLAQPKERKVLWNTRLFIARYRSMDSPSSTEKQGRKMHRQFCSFTAFRRHRECSSRCLTRLSDRYHLVAPDYPGFGHSDWPSPKQFAYTFDHIATVMDDFTEALGLSHYTLYMQDYGGPVGFRMALVIRNGWRRSSSRMRSLTTKVLGRTGKNGGSSGRTGLLTKKRCAQICFRSQPRRRAMSETIRRSSSMTRILGRMSTRFLMRQGRRRFKAISSMTTGRTLMLIRSGKHGCRRRSQSFWLSGASTISPSISGNRNVTGRMFRKRTFMSDAGHFALDTKPDEIATLVREFTTKEVPQNQ